VVGVLVLVDLPLAVFNKLLLVVALPAHDDTALHGVVEDDTTGGINLVCEVVALGEAE
jgi:hypothetical protein